MKKRVHPLLLLVFVLLAAITSKAQPLSGTYTINALLPASSTNFQSFKMAVDTLMAKGVSDTVIINVATGIYTEQVVITPIPGVSDTSIIVFQSAANHADSVTLNFAAGNNAPIVHLNGASYIYFKYITVASTTSNGRGFQLSTTASYNQILHCKITTRNRGIYGDPLSGRKNVISYNEITNCTYGIEFWGSSSILRVDSSTITCNKIQTVIDGTNYGISLNDCSNTLVANNSIISNRFGIRDFNNDRQRFYHNTILTSDNTSIGIYVNYSNMNDSANEWKNNIIVNSGTGNAVRIQTDFVSPGNVLDYNMYYTHGPNLFYNSATQYTTWQGTGQDSHSVVVNPTFVSNTDLRLTGGCSVGIPLIGIITDIEGNVRLNPPTLGAYEYSGINNMAVDVLLQPGFPISTGVQNIVVRVKNTGTNTITAFNLNYTLNGGTTVSQPWSGSPLAPCDTASVTISGVNLLGGNELTVYTSQPNGSPDTNRENDTLKAGLYSSMSGVYTIGTSVNDSFASFNAAVNSLVLSGVSGSVIFNIRTGTYTGQVIIPPITGASASNTITFQSAASNADSVLLTAATEIVVIDGASFINFKHLTLSATATTDGTAVKLTGATSRNGIRHCKISASGDGIRANPISGGNNVFSYNTLTAGYSCIDLRGNRNTLTDSNRITHNKMHSTTRTMFLSYCSNSLVANNSLTISGSSNGPQNIVSDHSNRERFYHNTIIVPENYNEFEYVYPVWINYFDVADSANKWFNNIMVSSEINGFHIPGPIGGINNQFDYNLYYSYGGINLSEFATWKLSGQDLNAILVDPGFVSDTDFHLNTSCKKGTPLVDVTDDIEGNLRGNPPTVGAYESAGVNNIAIDSLLTPFKPPFVAGSQDVIVRVKNTGVNTLTSFTINYTLNNGALVSQVWTGTLAPCDTISVVFTGAQQLNILTDSLYSLKVYTALPNGNPDTYLGNDTVRIVIRTPLHGGYTINSLGGADFMNFTDAVNMLRWVGINDTVILNVAAGTNYTEDPITITDITGSDLYPIIFQKSGSGSNPLVTGVNGTGSKDAIITLKSIHNIEFNGIDVTTFLGSPLLQQMEYGYKVMNSSVGGSSNNIIRNTKITLDRTNSNAIGLLQSASSTGKGGGTAALNLSMANHNNRYENIRIENCSYGILLEGTPLFPDTGNIITLTTIGSSSADDIGGNTTEAVYGIGLESQAGLTVSNCVVRNLSTSSVLIHGIYLNNNTSSFNLGRANISNNTVYNIKRTSTSTSVSGGVHGIRIDLGLNAFADVFNNVVFSLSSGNPGSPNAKIFIKGITHCQEGTGNAAYYHNSVSVTSTGTPNISSTAFWKGGGNPIIRNNVFLNTSPSQTGVAKHYAMYFNTPNPFYASNNNLFWSAGGNGYIGFLAPAPADIQTLYDWKLATGQDTNSLSYLPALLVANNLLPDSTDSTCWALNGRGVHLDSTIVNTDINGNPRPATREAGVPDIGAYEFTPTSLPPLATAVGSLAMDSTQTFLFGGDTVATIKWDPVFSVTLPTGIEVRQYTGTPPPSIPGAQNYMYAYTDIKALGTTPNYYNCNLNLYYQDAWLGTNPIEADVRMTQFHNSVWNPPFSMGIVSADVSRNILTAENLTSLGLFTGTDVYNPLPVKLLSFKANKIAKDVLLTWATASELNSDHFMVERSIDTKTWSAIGKVKANGNASSVNHYQLNDADAFKHAGTLFYRLRIIDNNGLFEYSKTVTVSNDPATANEKMVVYPNPFNEHITIQFIAGEDGEANIRMTDISGKRIQSMTSSSKITKGNNLISLMPDALQPGIYFLTIELNNGERQIVRVTKQ